MKFIRELLILSEDLRLRVGNFQLGRFNDAKDYLSDISKALEGNKEAPEFLEDEFKKLMGMLKSSMKDLDKEDLNILKHEALRMLGGIKTGRWKVAVNGIIRIHRLIGNNFGDDITEAKYTHVAPLGKERYSTMIVTVENLDLDLNDRAIWQAAHMTVDDLAAELFQGGTCTMRRSDDKIIFEFRAPRWFDRDPLRTWWESHSKNIEEEINLSFGEMDLSKLHADDLDLPTPDRIKVVSVEYKR